jgi:hypothetical protein
VTKGKELPRNKKLFRVRMGYPAEGGHTAYTLSVPLTWNDAQTFCTDMAREAHRGISTEIVEDEALVKQHEEDKATKRLASKPKGRT